MLAPAVMISACGLLLLGMNNKYAIVVNRIRLLNEEKRKFYKRAADSHLEYEDEVRLKSIDFQLHKLVYRVGIVKNAVLSYSIAIGFFVITSLWLGAGVIERTDFTQVMSITFFMAGMASVLAGVSFAAIETHKGYSIVQYEVNADD
ncbi:MAG: DUF2721 domain-containing protein [Ignavibacteriaceae bacterium]|nr:DUF2721 domain-containing protein [Ignavibacteriaceae bacterium]